MLPMPEYTHPEGPLNMVGFLQPGDQRPDLGPKSYIAFGRRAPFQLAPQPGAVRGTVSSASV